MFRVVMLDGEPTDHVTTYMQRELLSSDETAITEVQRGYALAGQAIDAARLSVIHEDAAPVVRHFIPPEILPDESTKSVEFRLSKLEALVSEA